MSDYNVNNVTIYEYIDENQNTKSNYYKIGTKTKTGIPLYSNSVHNIDNLKPATSTGFKVNNVDLSQFTFAPSIEYITSYTDETDIKTEISSNCKVITGICIGGGGGGGGSGGIAYGVADSDHDNEAKGSARGQNGGDGEKANAYVGTISINDYINSSIKIIRGTGGTGGSNGNRVNTSADEASNKKAVGNVGISGNPGNSSYIRLYVGGNLTSEIEGLASNGGQGGDGGTVRALVNARTGRGGNCSINTLSAYGGSDVTNNHDGSAYDIDEGDDPDNGIYLAKAINGNSSSMTINYAYSGTNAYSNESNAVWTNSNYGSGGTGSTCKIDHAANGNATQTTSTSGGDGFIKLYLR